MGIVDKAGKVAGVAGGLALVVKSVIGAEWDPETGQLAKVRLLGFIPVFDRRRMEARRARRAARKAK